jgi:hypothetical protein
VEALSPDLPDLLGHPHRRRGQYLLRPKLGAAYQTRPLVILSGYLLVHLGSRPAHHTVAWARFLEVLFYAMFAVLLLRKRWGALALGAWAIGCIGQLIHPGPPWIALYLLSPLNLLFLVGMTVGLRVRQVRLPYPYAVAGLGLLTFAGAFFACGVFPNHPVIVDLAAGLAAALVVLGGAAWNAPASSPFRIRCNFWAPRPTPFILSTIRF